ncbi:lytic murein transglycosylase [Mesorhizobium sp. M1B.F.Ca.ET.045.04.1.1]|nr:lytic murein transglycosylase [Mesorhizobium sp. M1B.F.Ca.ET.045.04.1.1]
MGSSSEAIALRPTPLCPAGHLPRKGGDWLFWRPASSCGVGDWRKPARHLISPLAGEMSGRTEGV